MQMSDKAENIPKIGSVIIKMSANLMSQIEPERLIRISLEDNVTYKPSTSSSNGTNSNSNGSKSNSNINNGVSVMSSVDDLIGRTAHICYLENPVVVEALLMNVYPYFS